MSAVKQWYSAAELAGMRLVGLPTSERRMIDRVKKDGYLSRQVPGKGGKSGLRTEYQPPKSVLALITNTKLMSEVAVIKSSLPAVIHAPVDTSQLTTNQRDVMQAREQIIHFVSHYAGTLDAALAYLNTAYNDKSLNTHLTWSLSHSWSKPREPLVLTRSTYFKWVAVKKARGVPAPLKREKDLRVKPWHAAAITLMQRPQGTTFRYVHDTLSAEFPYLSYDMITRFFSDEFSKIDVLKNRWTGSALKTHQKFNLRKTDDLLPWDELHMDGWATHATFPHPVSGHFVTYEIWHAHDMATRYTPPVSIGLTENFEVIAGCIENAIRFGGLIRTIQTDSARVIKNSKAMKTDPHIALANRFGFTLVNAKEVGNSQANGTPENYNQTLDRACRELATYQGKGMDTLTYKRVRKITEKMVKAQHGGHEEEQAQLKLEAEKMGKGLVFTSKQDAVIWINNQIDKTNNRPHRALPKIKDATTGKLRHETPTEALKRFVDAGWQPIKVDEEILIAEFRPQIKQKVYRQMVKPYGDMYYEHDALNHRNGEEVVVIFDRFNYEQVIVQALDGSLICIASYKAKFGRAKSYQEEMEEKRAISSIKLREKQIARIKENTPSLAGNVIEGEFTAASMLVFEEETPAVALKTMNGLLTEEVKEKESTYNDTTALLSALWAKEEANKHRA